MTPRNRQPVIRGTRHVRARGFTLIELLVVIAVIGILTSVVAAFYYVRLVMLMINGEPGKPFEAAMGAQLRAVLGGSMAFTLAMVVVPGILVGWAATAAAALVK